MDPILSKQALLAKIQRLEKESADRQRHERINHTLFKISNAVNTTSNLSELYGSIHRSLTHVLDTRNFFIAIYDPENDSATFPYCVDQVDGCLPAIKSGFLKTASLTAEVVRTGRALLIDREGVLAYKKRSGLSVPACSPSEIWLGAPLKSKGVIIGVIAVQSYTDRDLYDETDKDVLVSVADQVALAIERKQSEENREALIEELHRALEEVKTLQGILPICSKCKKIRDDRGYWNQIESYIQKHSDALFTHGICPECEEVLYGGEDWYKKPIEKEPDDS